MQMVWANARQGRHVLPIVKVVLHLPCQERRTQVARPLAMSKLPDGPPAGRKRRRQSVCRGLENLSRGTLGDSLWRHGKTWAPAQAHVCETGNIVGDVRQCRIVTPKNPPPLGVGSLQRVDFLISITCAETLWGKRNEKIGRDIRLGGGTSFVGNRECGAGAQSASLAGRT